MNLILGSSSVIDGVQVCHDLVSVPSFITTKNDHFIVLFRTVREFRSLFRRVIQCYIARHGEGKFVILHLTN